jgi:hypothetical protein
LLAIVFTGGREEFFTEGHRDHKEKRTTSVTGIAALLWGAAPAPRHVAGSLNRTSAIRLATSLQFKTRLGADGSFGDHSALFRLDKNGHTNGIQHIHQGVVITECQRQKLR